MPVATRGPNKQLGGKPEQHEKYKAYQREYSKMIRATEARQQYMRRWRAARRAADPDVAIYHNERSRAWRKTEKGRAAKRRRYYRTEVRIAECIRASVGGHLRRAGIKKKHSVIASIGCTIAELRAHLESRFKQGMTWDNYGDWHIDHIRPLSSFNLTDRAEQAMASHYTNLQPLWAADNIRKGATWVR